MLFTPNKACFIFTFLKTAFNRPVLRHSKKKLFKIVFTEVNNRLDPVAHTPQVIPTDLVLAHQGHDSITLSVKLHKWAALYLLQVLLSMFTD